MSDVSLLMDNDIVIKLAQMDVYEDAVRAISIPNGKSVASLRVMVRYMMRMAERRQRLTQAEADRLVAVLNTLVQIEPTTDEQKLSARLIKIIMEDELDMDEGEVALFAIALSRSGLVVATGDKRALRSLPQLERKFSDLRILRGRLICLEQIFKRLCQTKGMPRVRLAILACRDADGTLTQAYDYFEATGPNAFINGMDLVVADRITSVAPDWLMKL